MMKKLLGLDGLRGMLALGVALSHSYSHFTGWHTGYDIFHNPDYAVDVFFILSGIVLYYTYHQKIQSQAISPFDYVVVRFFRLYPLHILAVAMVPFALYISSGQFFPSWLGVITPYNLLGDITLTNSLGIGFVPKTNIPSWSISVEMFAGTVILLLSCIHRFMPWVLLASAIVLCLLLNIEVKGASQAAYPLLSNGVLRCWFCMSAGICALQVVLRYQPLILAWQKSARCYVSVCFIIMMIILFGLTPTLPFYLTFTVLMSLAICVFTCIDFELRRFFESQTLSTLGKYSFSIYIIHTPVVYLFLHFKSASYPLNILYATLAICATVILSKYTFNYIELPLHRYGKKLVPKKVTKNPELSV